jgi:hypothetical protein
MRLPPRVSLSSAAAISLSSAAGAPRADTGSNRLLAQKKMTELQQYIDDEYIISSFLLQLISAYSFYPIIFLL